VFAAEYDVRDVREAHFAVCILVMAAPVLRFLKLLRRFKKFQLVLEAFMEALDVLPVLLYTMCLLALSFASIIFIAEPRDNVSSLLTAMYFSIVSMTTVGYGDIAPLTTTGRVASVGLILCGALYMAIPIGIIGNAFNRSWERRHQIIIAKRTRERLKQWGYNKKDIEGLFMAYGDANGELNFVQFRNMLTNMNLGVREAWITEIFSAFDTDSSGSVDLREFVKAIFPGVEGEDFYQTEEDAAHKTNSVPSESSTDSVAFPSCEDRQMPA